MSLQPRRPSDPRELLHYYALFNLRSGTWSSVKTYPVDSKILALMPGFPKAEVLSSSPTRKMDGFRITPIHEAGFVDYVIEYDV